MYQLSCGETDFLPYCVGAEGKVFLVEVPGSLSESHCVKGPDKPFPLLNKLKRILKEVQAVSRTHLKEKFLSDLRKAREQHKGPDLAKVSAVCESHTLLPFLNFTLKLYFLNTGACDYCIM